MRRNSQAGMLASGGWSFSPFTQDEYREIHRATMEVLWETGVFVGHDEALTLFGDAGASVDMKNNMVRIPEWLIQEILTTVPETFVMSICFSLTRRRTDGMSSDIGVEGGC